KRGPITEGSQVLTRKSGGRVSRSRVADFAGERGRGVERERPFHLVSHLFNFGIRGAQPVCVVEKRERAAPVAPGPLDIGEKKDVVKVAGVFVDELRRDLVGFAQTAGVV